jgi:DNA-binding transcriptional regulator LsrR (DeoR family)
MQSGLIQELKYFRGLTREEIAAALGLTLAVNGYA